MKYKGLLPCSQQPATEPCSNNMNLLLTLILSVGHSLKYYISINV
jgi:hypothetical protein